MLITSLSPSPLPPDPSLLSSFRWQPKSLDGTGHSFDSSHHPSSPSHGSDSLGDEAEYNSHSEEEQAMHDDADLNEPVEHLVRIYPLTSKP